MTAMEYVVQTDEVETGVNHGQPAITGSIR